MSGASAGVMMRVSDYMSLMHRPATLAAMEGGKEEKRIDGSASKSGTAMTMYIFRILR